MLNQTACEVLDRVDLALHLLGKGDPVLFRYFGISRPSVWQAIKRGEKFAKENDVKLLN